MRVTLAGWVAAFGLLIVALSAGAAMAAAPNGVSTMTPSQALAAAKAAVAQAATVRVSGLLNDGSSPSFALNLSLTAGEVGSGTINVGGDGIDIVRIGTHAYLKGNKTFLAQIGNASVSSLLAGKWFEVASTEKGFADFVELTNLTQLIDSFLTTGGDSLTVTAPTRIGGQPAIGLADAKTGDVLYIATTGPAYPLEVKAPPGQGSLRMTSWNGPVRIVPPKNPLNFGTVSH